MKKLILSAAIILGGLFMNAEAAISKKSVLSIVKFQDNFKEIKLDALPLEVKATLEKSFPGNEFIHVNGSLG